jgi:mono/diheme cytochrome c family protein
MRITANFLLFGFCLAGTAAAADRADYLRDIKPLLAQHCSACHGTKVHKAHLRLDTAAAIRQGGQSGPAIVPGKSRDSLLIRAVEGASGVTRMPFKRPPLSPAQIALLKTWIDGGAPAPATEKAAEEAKGAMHWAFMPPVRSPLPAVKDPKWARNPIDRFILARLDKEGLTSSPEADRVTLIRRLSLDLLGLPPTPEEVDAFCADGRPDAYERLVDRLLASPHYGERWGRHWLDLARYADSNGYSIDGPREIWKYREWVINALNRDMPFREFVIEQIAGDMLPGATQEQQVATGFHRNTQINQEGGIDLEQFRVEAVADRVHTTGVVFLGLTLGCARCHDHKFDPITQKEYYQLFAFLNNQDEPTLALASPEVTAQREAIQAQIKKLAEEYTARQEAWLTSLTDEQRSQLKREIQVILNLGFEQRDAKQKRTLMAFFKTRAPDLFARLKAISDLERRQPKVPTTMVLRERAKPRETYVQIKGDFTRKGERVFPGVPAVLPPLKIDQGVNTPRSPNRLDLARWLVDPRNPLTPRVTVNRMWQHYFGKGLVETENDFGTQGSPPTHPQLLDWLATEFIAQDWSLKAIHRLIVTSATYRQSSRYRPELARVDPNNHLLARQARLRMEAEVIRDEGLRSSGLLNPALGGPSVFPPQPAGVFRFTQVPREWTANTDAGRYRRGLYTYFWRAAPHPALVVFDAPDAASSCTRRVRSNTPLQALTLLNDEAFLEFAQALAERVLREETGGVAPRLQRLFRLCLARRPSPSESQRLERFLSEQRKEFRQAPAEARALVPARLPAGTDVPELAAWTATARVLLNLDEFITRE